MGIHHDIIRRLEGQIIPNQFDSALSMQIDTAHLLRLEMQGTAL
jgi:hypothetical protein